jgi:hypothetical protein
MEAARTKAWLTASAYVLQMSNWSAVALDRLASHPLRGRLLCPPKRPALANRSEAPWLCGLAP